MQDISWSERNVVCLLVPYTHSSIPGNTIIYYIMFSASIYRKSDMLSNIRLGIIHSGTCLTSSIYRHQNEQCRYL